MKESQVAKITDSDKLFIRNVLETGLERVRYLLREYHRIRIRKVNKLICLFFHKI
jgi:hypothetical protein